MGDRVLEIVVHLMDYIRDNHGRFSDMDRIFADLLGLGYTDNEISVAYCWVMDRFDGSDHTYFAQFPESHHSTRILTDTERYQFSSEAYGFLIKLVHHDLIDDEQFESILERGTMFSPKPITLDQVKLLSSSVIFRDFHDLESLGLVEAGADPSTSIN